MVAARFHLPAIVTFLVLAASACAQGFQSAKDLESAERSPKDCARACEDIGLRMSAFVLVEKDVAGCVCEPTHTAPQLAAPAPSAPQPAPATPAPAPLAPATEPPAAPAAPAASPQSRVNSSATGAAAGYIVIKIRREASARQHGHSEARY